jgi:hypothetical protein
MDDDAFVVIVRGSLLDDVVVVDDDVDVMRGVYSKHQRSKSSRCPSGC